MQKFISKLRGIGLLELMLSLAIIAILLVMATRYFGMASKSQKIDDSIQMIGELESAVNTYITAEGEKRSSATLANLYTAGYLSKGRFKDGACASGADCTLKSIWGTGITYVPGDTGSSITFATIPLEACKELGKRFYGTDTGGTVAAGGCDATGNFYYLIK